jgi:hypothetical protein
MEFLIHSADYKELADARRRYTDYLRSVRADMPPEVFEFATASWHYDPADHRSLHDSWVEAVAVRESLRGANDDAAILSIELRLLAPYHDGLTTLLYEDVSRYEMSLRMGSAPSADGGGGHGDWLVDEVRLVGDKRVLHEIEFSSGARWIIECGTLVHSTTAPPRQY